MTDSLGLTTVGVQNGNWLLGVQAQNLANSEADAFKASVPKFLTLVSDTIPIGVLAETGSTIGMPGPFKNTGISTNMAFESNSMFVVKKGDTIGYTRAGSFTQNAENILVNDSQAILMGWKIDGSSQNTSLTIDTLEEINFRDVGIVAIPTTDAIFDMNLDAIEESAKSNGDNVNITYSQDVSLGMNDIIIPDNENIVPGDKIQITDSLGNEVILSYGGIARSTKISATNHVAGATTSFGAFTDATDGSILTVSTEKSGDIMFQFSKNVTTSANNTFNSLSTLADAMNDSQFLNARIGDDGMLYVSPTDATDSLHFIGDTSFQNSKFNLNTIFNYDAPQSQLTSVDPYKTPVFEVSNTNDTFVGIPDDTGFFIRLNDGSDFAFNFKTLITDPTSGEFNSFDSLATAINASTDGKLKATTGTKGISIYIDEVLHPSVNIISVMQNNGVSVNIPQTLGIDISSIFTSSITDGDGIQIDCGNYRVLNSSAGIHNTTPLNQVTSVISNIINENEIFDNIQDGDDITIITDTVSEIYTYGSSGDFTTIQELVTAINNNSGNVSASYKKNILEITSTDNINSITSTNGQLSSMMNINFIAPNDGDTLLITLTSGDKATFTFVNDNNAIDIDNGRFNSIQDLNDSINASQIGKHISSTYRLPGVISIVPSSEMGADIISCTGNVANSLFFDNKIPFKKNFTFRATNPDTLSNEFNDLFTLKQAIENANNEIKVEILGNKKDGISLISNATTRLKYICDTNNNGNSDIATHMGIAGTNFVASLGLENTITKSDRFATLSNLNSAINTNSFITSDFENNQLVIYSGNITTSLEKTNINTNKGVDTLKFLGLEATQEFGYQATDNNRNISSSAVSPNFTQTVKIYDSLGASHDIQMSFLKIQNNMWDFEVYVSDKSEISTTRTDGLLSYGTLKFSGDGFLEDITTNNVTSILSSDTNNINDTSNLLSYNIPVNAVWNNGANPTEMLIHLGNDYTDYNTQQNVTRANESTLTQFAGHYSMRNTFQNGLGTSSLLDINISNTGQISAILSNGTSVSTYQIASADFANIENLRLMSNSIYVTTPESGEAEIGIPGQGKAGYIHTSFVEGSNVDISNEMLNMVTTKNYMNALIRLLSLISQELDDLSKTII